MHKKITRLALCALLFAQSFPAQAQQPKKVPRIGYLTAIDPAMPSDPVPRHSAGSARARLHRRTEHRHRVPIWEGKQDRYPELAAELVRLKVDVIVVAGGIRRSGRPRMRPRRFPSLWWALSILSRLAWWKALPVPAETSPALQGLPEN